MSNMKWKNGDCVGCCLDLENAKISYILEGVELGMIPAKYFLS